MNTNFAFLKVVCSVVGLAAAGWFFYWVAWLPLLFSLDPTGNSVGYNFRGFGSNSDWFLLVGILCIVAVAALIWVRTTWRVPAALVVAGIILPWLALATAETYCYRCIFISDFILILIGAPVATVAMAIAGLVLVREMRMEKGAEQTG